MILLSFSETQPFLFESLPEDPSRRRSRRRRALGADPLSRHGDAEDDKGDTAAAGATSTAASGSGPALCGTQVRPSPPFLTMPVFRQVDAGGLTNPEILELIRSLSDLRLSFLVVEAVRELKRRTRPGEDASSEENPFSDGNLQASPPNPSLLRAGRLVQAELLETE